MLRKLEKMMMSKKALPILILVLTVGLFGAFSCKGHNNEGDTLARQQELLMYIGMVMERDHYSPKNIDDAFSQKVFNKYLDNIDGDKDIFLQKDIDSLKSKYEFSIDDEIHGQAQMAFFPAAFNMLNARIQKVKAIYTEILSKPFDFTVNEQLQLNADSAAFPKTEDERIDIWRRRMKYQTLIRYLDLLAQRDKAKDGDSLKLKTDDQLQKEARDNVKRIMDRSFRRFSQQSNEEQQYSLFVNTIVKLMDPHTDYFPPVEKREFDEEMSNKFYGIGAGLIEQLDGTIKIGSIIYGSPVWKSGKFHINDIITKVAQGDQPAVDIGGYTIQDAIKIIRGEKGTKVRITIRKASDGSTEEIPLIREKIEQDELAVRSAVINQNGKKIGYIYLPEFYDDFNDPNGARCATDVANEITKLKRQNIQGLIFDLRYNNGGSLMDVIQMVGLFIKNGPIVQVRDRSGKVQQLNDDDPGVLYTGPMTVMVNEMSASAAEIFAAAIQDYHRGIIIGSDSYGKGTVQRQLPIGRPDANGQPEFGALKLTFQKFYRINGGSTQREGVSPDIALPDNNEFLKIRERDDPTSLPWDKIAPAKYTDWIPTYNVARVKLHSEERVKASISFRTIRANSEWLGKNYDKPVQLNINTYKAELEEQKKVINRDDSIVRLKIPLNLTVVPENYNKFYKNEDTAKGQRYQQWLKDTGRDIYINEALNIINDMLVYATKPYAKH